MNGPESLYGNAVGCCRKNEFLKVDVKLSCVSSKIFGCLTQYDVHLKAESSLGTHYVLLQDELTKKFYVTMTLMSFGVLISSLSKARNEGILQGFGVQTQRRAVKIIQSVPHPTDQEESQGIW